MTSIYNGVSVKKNRHGREMYVAKIQHNKKTVEIGWYKDEKLAAKAFDKYVLKYGLDKETNFLKKKLAQ